MTQLSINNGETLFQTGYDDPPFVARQLLNTGYQWQTGAAQFAAAAAAAAAAADHDADL